MHVLIVEDEPEMARLLMGGLARRVLRSQPGERRFGGTGDFRAGIIRHNPVGFNAS